MSRRQQSVFAAASRILYMALGMYRFHPFSLENHGLFPRTQCWLKRKRHRGTVYDKGVIHVARVSSRNDVQRL